jgi:hypothetical protein
MRGTAHCTMYTNSSSKSSNMYSIWENNIYLYIIYTFVKWKNILQAMGVEHVYSMGNSLQQYATFRLYW